jgi:hypothetical protein
VWCAGLHKLWEMKDNHIFRGLATLAAPGTTLEQATSVGKDVVQVCGTLLFLGGALESCQQTRHSHRVPRVWLARRGSGAALGDECHCGNSFLKGVLAQNTRFCASTCLQRVGAKGPAAEVARALVSCMTPSLLPPELLHMAMEHAADSQEGELALLPQSWAWWGCCSANMCLAQAVSRTSRLCLATTGCVSHKQQIQYRCP